MREKSSRDRKSIGSEHDMGRGFAVIMLFHWCCVEQEGKVKRVKSDWFSSCTQKCVNICENRLKFFSSKGWKIVWLGFVLFHHKSRSKKREEAALCAIKHEMFAWILEVGRESRLLCSLSNPIRSCRGGGGGGRSQFDLLWSAERSPGLSAHTAGLGTSFKTQTRLLRFIVLGWIFNKPFLPPPVDFSKWKAKNKMRNYS